MISNLANKFSESSAATKIAVVAGSLLGVAGIYSAVNYIKKEVVSPSSSSSAPEQNKEVLTVFVTGAAGQIGHSLLPLLLSGQCFGERPIRLRLLDLPTSVKTLEGIKLELHDGAYKLLESIEIGSDPEVIFKDAEVGIFLGGFPRKQGMERKDLLAINGKIFSAQGQALEKVAKKDVKCLVVANPANTNCLILSQNAPSIPKENFTALTRLDQNRSVSQLAQKSNSLVTDVKNVIIWGNHSSTQYPDVNHGTIKGEPIRQVIKNDNYLDYEFVKTVRNRGAEIIEVKSTSSVFSAANAVKDHLHDWYFGTKSGEFVSMAVYSNGEYKVASGVIFSFPVTCKDFTYKIVEDLDINPLSREQINATNEELVGERELALS